jgi:hypothetical protein
MKPEVVHRLGSACASRDTLATDAHFESVGCFQGLFGGAPKRAGEAPALPTQRERAVIERFAAHLI